MDKTILAVMVAVLLSAIGALADYYLKLASGEEQIVCNKWFAIALVVYSSTHLRVGFCHKEHEARIGGVVYSICMVLFLTFMGVVFFKERLSYREVIGIGLAIASLILLTRFAE